MAARKATYSIKSLMEERGRNKNSRQDGPHKRPAVCSPQLLDLSTSDLPYVMVPKPESFGTDDFVMCLEGGEEVASTTANDTAGLQKTDRALPTYAKVNKMCKKFDQSMVMGSVATEAPLKRNPKCQK